MNALFKMSIRIDNVQTLFIAAAAHDDCTDPNDLMHADGSVNIGACLQVLLDPGQLAGCDITGCDTDVTDDDEPEEARRVFEVLGQRFDGGTDATDDRVLWIVADSLNDVTAAINGMGGSVSEVLDMGDDMAGELGVIDFTLPGDAAALRERMAKWVQA